VLPPGIQTTQYNWLHVICFNKNEIQKIKTKITLKSAFWGHIWPHRDLDPLTPKYDASILAPKSINGESVKVWSNSVNKYPRYLANNDNSKTYHLILCPDRNHSTGNWGNNRPHRMPLHKNI